MALLTPNTDDAPAAVTTITNGVGVTLKASVAAGVVATRGLVLKVAYSVDGTNFSDYAPVSGFEVIPPVGGSLTSYIAIPCPGATKANIIVRNTDQSASITDQLITHAY
jgi:hypothetical protein